MGPVGPALDLAFFDDNHHTLIIGLVLFKLYIRVPKFLPFGHDFERGYGFNFNAHDAQFHWGHKTKILYYPWSWRYYQSAILRPDGSTWKRGRDVNYLEVPEPFKEKHRYNYLRHNGEVQTVEATIVGYEMESRLYWFPWLSWPAKITRYIDIKFSDEVGEGVGSYKGGTVGTGFRWERGERMVDALRKAERELIFSR